MVPLLGATDAEARVACCRQPSVADSPASDEVLVTFYPVKIPSTWYFTNAKMRSRQGRLNDIAPQAKFTPRRLTSHPGHI
jgi:hypothetical protein